MYEDVLFRYTLRDHWQMEMSERIAMVGVLARLRPKGALEVGVYFGGSLSLTSQFAERVIGIDIDPQVPERFTCPSNAEIWIGDSRVCIPAALSDFDRAGIPVNFILVDADHSAAGVARDLELILHYRPREPLFILIHDSGNVDCRRGILGVNWESNPHVHDVEIDFVPGRIVEHTVNNGRGEIWGGFALAYLDPQLRQGPLQIRESAATSLKCQYFLVDNLPSI